GRRPVQRRAHLDRPALPAGLDVARARGRLLGAEELQLLVLLRLARAARARDPDRHGHLPDHELQARREGGLCLGRVHHARGELGLVDPLHAFHGRLVLLHLRVPAHVPRAALRLLPPAARAGVDGRDADLPLAHGRGLLRLPPALGADVVLGRAGDREPVRRDSRDRTQARDLDPRRLRGLGRDAEPLLRVPRDRGAARAARARGRAPARAARGRLEQSRRHRHQRAGSEDRAPDRQRRVPPVLHGEGFVRRVGVPGDLLRRRVLPAGDGRLLPRVEQLHPGRPLKTPPHIAPVWYFTPFYSILRATTDNFV